MDFSGLKQEAWKGYFRGNKTGMQELLLSR